MSFLKKEKKRALWTQAFPTQYETLQAGASHKKNLRIGAKNCIRSKSFAKLRKPVKRVSSKKAKSDRIYNARVKVWIKNKMCHCCSKMASETHHQRGRIGSLLMDERFWIPLCSEHHRWVHDNPTEAREKGLLAPAGEFNSGTYIQSYPAKIKGKE